MLTKTRQEKVAEDRWMIIIGASSHYHDRLKSIDLHEFDSLVATGPSYIVDSG